MSLLNKNAAALSKKHGGHGSTDVTGFGILGHAYNLVEVQKKAVDFHIRKLPIFDRTDVVCQKIADFGLPRGTSAETSGGLFLIMPSDKADPFMRELK